ncbi:MAG: beta-ketoacyl synthase chain length factor [Treponema sp.]|uniref:beta-ketoacyl synthase chain length factor n=1 Tax=Treponema sp. TaxID=166 RepID=UPI00298DB6B6|nr:beta-ketoacyl synthase chain length factor [Treponema sp.]MBR5933388.1 beta-ketoacyl synthase chain length factor [Treponema sp.]
MEQKSFFISEPSLVAPGLESLDDWKLFAQNEKQILLEKTSPSLSYTDPLFRRRLSQISKMTVESVHNLIEKTNISLDKKLVFASFRGEIEREFKLNKSIIEDQMILPAGFSLSVFNTPAALATIACKLKAGYTTVFPSDENFSDALLCGASPVLSGKEESIIFVYSDELIPEEYKNFAPEGRFPLSFAFIISSKPLDNSFYAEYQISSIEKNVYKFIQFHLKKCYNKL